MLIPAHPYSILPANRRIKNIPILALPPISSRITKDIPVGFGILLCFTVLIITISGAYLWLPAKVHYHIVEKHKVSASKDRSNVKIGIVIPSSSPYQTVSDPIIRWEGEQERINYAYLDVYKLWGEISPGQPQEAVLEYEITLPQGKISWESPVEQRSILPQVGIESNHPAIINQARELSSEPYRIYQFIAHHLIFSEQNCADTNKFALEAYRLATGACAGYSRLMVALCRAWGTPARMIIGSILPDNYFPSQHRNAAGIPAQGMPGLSTFPRGIGIWLTQVGVEDISPSWNSIGMIGAIFLTENMIISIKFASSFIIGRPRNPSTIKKS